ncbi:MAG: divergent polysaccharide deacetylase family protein [Deltaproteobacteria bacterium]
MPPAVSFAVPPNSRAGERLMQAARARGHELLAVIPMEPSDYPAANPGANALLTGAAPAQNALNLEWALSRFTGYAGVTNGYTLSFNKLFQNWGSTNYTGSTFDAIGLGTGQSLDVGSSGFTVIPEPATVGMIGLGALVTLLIRRMRA